MTSEPYDESKASDDYLSRCFDIMISSAERSEYQRANVAAKTKFAQLSDHSSTKKRAKTREALIDEIGAESRAIVDRIEQRIRREYESGRLVVNRCPECSRIVRTPLAKQCLWCGHDWHDE